MKFGRDVVSWYEVSVSRNPNNFDEVVDERNCATMKEVEEFIQYTRNAETPDPDGFRADKAYFEIRRIKSAWAKV